MPLFPILFLFYLCAWCAKHIKEHTCYSPYLSFLLFFFCQILVRTLCCSFERTYITHIKTCGTIGNGALWLWVTIQLQTSFKLSTRQKTLNYLSCIYMFLLSLLFLRCYDCSFMSFLFLFKFYNGCVLWNPQEARVGDVIAGVEKQWNVI